MSGPDECIAKRYGFDQYRAISSEPIECKAILSELDGCKATIYEPAGCRVTLKRLNECSAKYYGTDESRLSEAVNEELSFMDVVIVELYFCTRLMHSSVVWTCRWFYLFFLPINSQIL